MTFMKGYLGMFRQPSRQARQELQSAGAARVEVVLACGHRLARIVHPGDLFEIDPEKVDCEMCELMQRQQQD